MRLSLSSHPNLAMTRRTYMWPHFFGRYGDLGIPGNFERCLAAMQQHKPIRALSPDLERIRREFGQGEPSYARLFALFHQHYAERMGKSRWGDQTGTVEYYADRILAAYPTARLIHMIRDPRDRYEVSRSAKHRSRGGIGGATLEWRDSVDLARRNRHRYADRYLVVRYEDLVYQREQTLREVCAFIGEEYVPGMLSLEHAMRYGDEAREGGDKATMEDTDLLDSSTGACVPLSQREVAFIQRIAGEDMRLYGYQPRPIRLSLCDRLLFSAVDCPANFARIAVWRAIAILRASFPAYLGRKHAAVIHGRQPITSNG
jgi:hypothetical protein